MSEENVEAMRRVYRDPEPWPFFDLLDEEVEVDFSTHPLPDFPVFIRGKDEALEATEIIDAGEDRVVVLQRERGLGRGSGVPFELHAAIVFTLRAGKLMRVQFLRNREEALEAAGLREGASWSSGGPLRLSR
jgi:ketosteroid isomerase-like protein